MRHGISEVFDRISMYIEQQILIKLCNETCYNFHKQFMHNNVLFAGFNINKLNNWGNS
jgi:hypothetical protein